jgi:TonB-linked SusC/RagA family outer membrane protein
MQFMQATVYCNRSVLNNATRLTFILLTTALLHISARGLSQTITLSVKDMELQQVFTTIEKTTGFVVFYNKDLLKDTRPVSLTVKDMPLADFMSAVLKGQPLHFRIVGKTIVLSRKTTVPQEEPVRIKGKVTAPGGEALPGVSIKVKDAPGGTVTDAGGNFTLLIPGKNAVLQFSSIGYVLREITIADQRDITVALEESSRQMNEVVVTALGIKREKKALGYAVGEVGGEELNKAREPNVINSLAGKVPGLVINTTAGGPSGSTRVIIRGNTELSGNNQPLYVVDGVPIDNSNPGSAGTYGGYDLGDGISSINPDDIESVSVLKGPAASALYGSRASHGVILITTKKGVKKKDLGIELNSTSSFERILTRFENYQYIYGQGNNGQIPGRDERGSVTSNWGAKLDPGLTIIGFDGKERPYALIPNNIQNFFRTGMTFTNTVSFSTGSDQSTLRGSVSDMRNTDILPNSDMSRNTFTLRGTSRFGKKLNLDAKVNYIKEKVHNRPALSDSKNNAAYSLIGLANNYDQAWLANFKDQNGTYYDWNGGNPWRLNPYWSLYEMSNKSEKNRIIASGQIRYDFTPAISAQLTSGIDYSSYYFEEYIPRTTPGDIPGRLKRQSFENLTYNHELLITARKSFNDISLSANIGGSIFGISNTTTEAEGKNMKGDAISLNSYLQKDVRQYAYRKEINSAFGMLSAGYKSFLFLDATLRRDESSTLPISDNTYFYPSVSGSFIFTDAFKLTSKWLNFGKLRASWAQVGGDTNPFQLALSYNLLGMPYEDYGLAYIAQETKPNPHLRPSRTSSVELGTELKFLSNRLGLDFTYYRQNSKDQIVTIPSSVTSGFRYQVINAGEIVNNGIEVLLTGSPLRKKNFSWDVSVNFARNVNKVISLAPGLDDLSLAEARWAGARIVAKKGELYGAIIGKDFKRSPDGQIILDANTALPIPTDNFTVLGKGTWDWTGGLSSTFNYKGIYFTALFDVKWGADLFSMTNMIAHSNGSDKNTLEGRDGWIRSEEERQAADKTSAEWTPTGGYLPKGVVEEIDASGKTVYKPNTRYVNPTVWWQSFQNTGQIPTPYIYDASYIKVRELTLGYSLPKEWLKKTFVAAAALSVVSRNPFILYKRVPNVDPDSNYNNSNGQGLEYGSLPTRKSWGINVNVKF